MPRGAGTGLSGGAGSVVVDLSRMNRILELNPEEQTTVVEPGVITAELDRAAGESGLRYAPDPASSPATATASASSAITCVSVGFPHPRRGPGRRR